MRRAIPWAAGLLILALACDSALERPPGRRGEARPAAQAPAVVEVATAWVRRGTLLPRIVAPGSVVARRQSEIGAEVTGRIERVFVDVGDRVEAGDLLFEIDRSSYAAALAEAQAALDLARAERRQSEADVRRGRELHGKAVLSKQELERLETRLAVARAQEERARAALEIAQQNLERTRVLAPYAGTVAQRLADEGTTARTMPQTIVVVLQETAELEGRAHLPEDLHRRVRVGDRAELSVEGLPEPIETRITAVADAIDPETRTFLVRMRVANPDHRIKAGAFARVVIHPQPLEDVLIVPREALRSQAGRTTLLVVREGVAVEVPVEVGVVTESEAEVLTGIAAGDEVVVGPAARDLAPGTRVRGRGPAPGAPA